MPPVTGVHVRSTADWPMPEGMMMQLGGDELRPAKCPFYVLEHPEALVLVDTGLSHELVADPEGYGAPGLAELVPAIELDATTTEHLADLGYEPADVDHVVCTHLHMDHVGRLDAFPDATTHVHVDELRYAWWPDPAQAGFYVDRDLEPLRDPDRTVREVVGRTDLLGDGSIELLPTPGHTPGHLSVLVDRGDDRVLLAADAANLRAGYEAELVAPFAWSAAESVESIRRLKAETREGDTVVVHHDPEDLARLE